MTAVGLVWSISAIVAFGLLPVGALRMVAYRSGEVDHTQALRFVAWLAVVLGGLGALVFVVLTVWFVATERRPF
jgi:hypothetical protein